MTDHELLLEAIRQTQMLGKRSALATIVNVSGSAYRREGTKMLIDEDANLTGVISGGCLESDVAEVAMSVIETGTPVLKTYDLGEDVVWGLGLGCPGTVKIFIEPVRP
ncbi:XdhC family protein [Niallia oryzisoli]|uniref:XdhC family protein n=1 Tax=Niallia oryzisoli TaxID=1737571 RepID=A0ABZ2CBE5_9BACI